MNTDETVYFPCAEPKGSQCPCSRQNDDCPLAYIWRGDETSTGYIPEPCKTCSNHPSNGGSGICNCILGLPTIT